jgi:hypothetical protein
MHRFNLVGGGRPRDWSQSQQVKYVPNEKLTSWIIFNADPNVRFIQNSFRRTKDVTSPKVDVL